MARFGTTEASREQIRALLASAVLYFWVEGGGPLFHRFGKGGCFDLPL
jgi:hypothetical protein